MISIKPVCLHLHWVLSLPHLALSISLSLNLILVFCACFFVFKKMKFCAWVYWTKKEECTSSWPLTFHITYSVLQWFCFDSDARSPDAAPTQPRSLVGSPILYWRSNHNMMSAKYHIQSAGISVSLWMVEARSIYPSVRP